MSPKSYLFLLMFVSHHVYDSNSTPLFMYKSIQLTMVSQRTFTTKRLTSIEGRFFWDTLYIKGVVLQRCTDSRQKYNIVCMALQANTVNSCLFHKNSRKLTCLLLRAEERRIQRLVGATDCLSSAEKDC